MPDPSEESKEPGVRVLTPDGDDARAVAKAMASSTAGGILRCFHGRELTASDIASELHLPIPTVMYHLDALLDAGLVEVFRIRYSVKGREVKVYRQSDQILIVAPSQADLRSVLLKYASLFGITLFGAGIVAILMQITSSDMAEVSQTAGAIKEKAVLSAVANSPAEVVSDSLYAGYSQPMLPPGPAPMQTSALFGIPDLSAGILIGGFLVIGLLLCFEIAGRFKNR